MRAWPTPLERPRRPLRARLVAVAGVLTALWWVLVPATARAAPACAFDGMTATVTVDVGNGEAATIVRVGDAITLDGSACDTATVTNTDAIVVNGTGIPASVTIDLQGGPFAPGATPEADGGDSEIEFTIALPAGSPTVRVAGSSGSDTIVVGQGGINMNATEAAGDADVLIVGLPVIVIDGNASGDTLSVAGGSGTGAERAATLNGGTENDTLFGAGGGSTLNGDDGVDTVNYTASGAIDAELGAGTVSHPAAQVDQVATIENVTGSPQADEITGDGGANVLLGGDGGDLMAGGGGDDTIDGQAGTDTIDYRGSPAGVFVNLPGENASGDGADRVVSMENVKGSGFDDRLVGDNGPNVIEGLDGNDRIAGAGGDDTLDGGNNQDTLEFELVQAGVTVDLRDGTSKGDGNDTVADFENVTGTDFADTIHADDGKNIVKGGSGADTLYGHDGKDQVKGQDGADRLFGQHGNDDVLGDKGKDQLDGGKGNDDVCKGGKDPDSFVDCEHITLG